MKQLHYIIALVFISIAGIQAQHLPKTVAQKELVEKVYLHTDRSMYFPGETLWFKGYITNAQQEATALSDVMYVALISPQGQTISKKTYEIDKGAVYGHFDFDSSWVGGVYTLKAYSKWMLNQGESSLFTKKITLQKVVEPKLQMTFDFDKESYGAGSELTAKLLLKDLENNPVVLRSCVLHLQIDGKIVEEKEVLSNASGEVHIKLELPKTLDTTDVLVNVSIPHQGIQESISRSVPILLDKIDLQFLPESGAFMAGFQNKLAFKAVDVYGKPADVAGVIKNSSGQIVTHFESFHNGMGHVRFVPKSGEVYTAYITAPLVSSQPYALPIASEKGIRFELESSNNKHAFFTVYSSKQQTAEWIVSDVYEQVYRHRFILKKGRSTTKIPIGSYKTGITSFKLQLLDSSIIAERLVYLHPNRKLDISITTNQSTYDPREKVDVLIQTKDYLGNPIPANISVSVADNKLLRLADDRQDQIHSYFLLSSELKGNIYKPQFYFDINEVKAEQALDYVMLTHGWRNYIIQDNLNIANAQYAPERLSVFSGQVVDGTDCPIKDQLLFYDHNSQQILTFETNDNGTFMFELEEGIACTLLAYNQDGDHLTIKSEHLHTSQNYVSQIMQAVPKVNSNQPQKNVLPFKPGPQPIVQKVIKNDENAAVSLNMEPDNLLESVVVTAQGMKREKRALGYTLTRVASEDIELRNAGDIARILSGKASGVQITQQQGASGATTQIAIRGYNTVSGNTQPLFVVDGIPYSAEGQVSTGSTIGIDTAQIESVNVIDGIAAVALYGTAGSNGVIIIKTKYENRYNHGKGKKLKKRVFNNYASAHFYEQPQRNYAIKKQFYVPIYDSKEVVKQRTDFRSTIYWNPIVQTDQNGVATLSYYNSDAVSSFNITAEGIDTNGRVGRKEHDYSITKALEIDCKLPAYMSLGDEVTLTVTLRNATSEVMNTLLDINLPEGMKRVTSETSKSLTISPNSVSTVAITLIPELIIQDAAIALSATASGYQDFVRKTTTVISPYFPTEVNIAGNQSGNYTFDMNEVVAGSLYADFTLYTDIIGDVMDGIESLLRQPYGCFEQTSATVYPNIMVLQYLRASGKSNPAIEQKAMNYIRKGYERLISFETSQGGFEWFGKTPPHETLTAFGILEFTEMKTVHPEVSQAMIDRTVKWLLSRKDGKGGFKKSNKGYDSFASSPADVANAYIVYALATAQLPIDIEKEYQQVLTDAIKSKDAYKLALTANAAYQLQKTEDFKLLVALIKEQIDHYGFGHLPVMNTITRSYGNDKQTETLAFSILAMLHSDIGNDIYTTDAINYLIKQRRNNRFGATQATAMALKALIAYTQTQKARLLDNTQKVTLSVNQKQIQQVLAVTPDGKIRVPLTNSLFTSGKNQIKIAFSNPEVTFPFQIKMHWNSTLPSSSTQPMLDLKTEINNTGKVGQTLRMNITATNTFTHGHGMVTAMIGLPAGANAQPWQLKQLIEENKIAFYEMFDNYLVLYWRSFDKDESKQIAIDLKAEVAGRYTAAASVIYPYYGEEFKRWIPGVQTIIK